MTSALTKFDVLLWFVLIALILVSADWARAQSQGPPDQYWHLEVEDLRADTDGGLLSDRVFFVFHDGNFDLFDFGKPAPEGLRWFANHGFIDQILEQLNDESGENWRLEKIGLAIPEFDGNNSFVSPPGPFVRPESDRYLTYFSRIYPSDDAFVGNADPKRFELFDEEGHFEGPVVIDVYGSDVIDAGTKDNLEQDLIAVDRHFFDERANPETAPFTTNSVMPHPGFNGAHGNPDGEPARLMIGGETYCQETASGDEFCHEYDPDQIDFSKPGSPLMRLRVNLVGPGPHGAWSGSYYDPSRSGEGFNFEFFDTDPPKAVFYWYTFKPDGSGEPMWLVGQGEVNGEDYFFFDFDIYEVDGGSMAALTNPQESGATLWGEATVFVQSDLSSPACRSLALYFTPLNDDLELDLPSGSGNGRYRYDLERLTSNLTGLDKYCGNSSGVRISVHP